MRRLFTAIAVICCFSATSQVQSDCTVSAAFRNAYERDAQRLAITRMYELQVADTQFIDAPQIYTDSILAGLAAVFNLDEQLEADSVFQYHCLHLNTGFQSSGFPGVELTLDPSFAWTQQWASQQTTTGYGALDSFLSHYGFSLLYYIGMPGIAYATLTTTEAINLKAFGDSLLSFSGITSASPYFPAGEGKGFIRYIYDGQQHYQFRIGWGDCPAGCTDYKSWYYTVDPASCAVMLDSIRLEGNYWNGYPALVNCNLKPDAIARIPGKIDIQVYPNPARDILGLRVRNYASLNYSITDLNGKTVVSGQVSGRALIDISSLAPGVYLLTAGKEGAGTTMRFVKQ